MSHVISVLTENKPGVLARVSSMFARRGFNIHSLAVGPTSDPTVSRMTVVVDGPEMEQIIKQLYKLVHVVKVTEMSSGESIEREIMMVRVNADPKRRHEILDAARIFSAEPVDVGVATVTFELSGEPRPARRLPRVDATVRDRRPRQVRPDRPRQGRQDQGRRKGDTPIRLNVRPPEEHSHATDRSTTTRTPTRI